MDSLGVMAGIRHTALILMLLMASSMSVEASPDLDDSSRPDPTDVFAALFGSSSGGCDTSRCQNGGTCIQLDSNTHRCKCPEFHRGAICEILCSGRIAHGQVAVDGTVTCDDGYSHTTRMMRPDGLSLRTPRHYCNHVGQWQGNGMCIESLCKSTLPSSIVDTAALLSGAIGDVVEYRCGHGYAPVAGTRAVCTAASAAQQQWEGLACMPIPGYCKHGNRLLQVDQHITVSPCNFGFAGTSLVTCASGNETNGTLVTRVLHTCQIKTHRYCDMGRQALPTGVTFRRRHMAGEIGDVHPVLCLPGYEPTSDSEAVCTAGNRTQGIWHGMECRVVMGYCDIRNGPILANVKPKPSYQRGVIGQVRSVRCLRGYEPVREETVCTANTTTQGYWKGMECRVITNYCNMEAQTLPVGVSSELKHIVGAIGEVAPVHCLLGYEQASEGAVCTNGTKRHGVWTGLECRVRSGYCDIRNGPAPAHVKATKPFYRTGVIGESVHVRCRGGYAPVNLKTVCMANTTTQGFWQGMECRLLQRYCNMAQQSLPYGVTFTQEHAVGALGDVNPVHCLPGFVPASDGAVCTASIFDLGYWSGMQCRAWSGYCDIRNGSGPAHVADHTIYHNGWLRQEVPVHCMPGYEPVNAHAVCAAKTATEGFWRRMDCRRIGSSCDMARQTLPTGVTFNGGNRLGVIGDVKPVRCALGYEPASEGAVCTNATATQALWQGMECRKIGSYCNMADQRMPIGMSFTQEHAVGAIGDVNPVHCDVGFERPRPAVCEAGNATHGFWRGSACFGRPRYCDISNHSPAPANVLTIYYKHGFIRDSQAVYCMAGYQAVHERTVCTAVTETQGIWQGLECTAMENYCTMQEIPKAAHVNTKLMNQNSAIGESQLVHCLPGYEPVNENAVCTLGSYRSGVWQGLECRVRRGYCDLGHGATPAHVKPVSLYNRTVIGQTRRVKCNHGYRPINSSKMATCVAGDATNGVWQGLECIPRPWYCVYEGQRLRVGQTVAWRCPEGQRPVNPAVDATVQCVAHTKRRGELVVTGTPGMCEAAQ